MIYLVDFCLCNSKLKSLKFDAYIQVTYINDYQQSVGPNGSLLITVEMRCSGRIHGMSN